MKPRRIRTAPLDGNQARIDELEYFLEGIGRFLFGEEGEDFRKLAGFVPRTRNLSALIRLGRPEQGDVSEDLRFIYGELEARAGRTPIRPDDATPNLKSPGLVFRYERYLDLLLRPEKLLEKIEPSERLQVVTLIARGVDTLAPTLARLNAYAWLGVVGMPDLEEELRSTEPAAITIPAESARVEEGLDELITSLRGRVSAGLRAYCFAVYGDLCENYRRQLLRIGATTSPL